MTFLWSVSGSTEETTELIYNVVEDAYNTRITFKRDKTFKGSDGMGGLWSFEGGKLILTALDAKDGFTIKFDPPTSSTQQLKGIVTSKGRWHGRHIILKASPKSSQRGRSNANTCNAQPCAAPDGGAPPAAGYEP